MNAGPTAELTRPLAVGRLGDDTHIDVVAQSGELAALARRMGLQALHSLSCSFDLQHEAGQSVRARGTLRARVVQICVATLEPFEAEVEEEFVVRFVPEGQESDVLDMDAEDEIPYRNGTIDLGEAAAEQLALALDPFPRKPGVAFIEEESEPVSNPFEALTRRLS